MIKVLQVVGRMHYGGMETFIMNIYRHINRNKVQFDFMVHYDEPGGYDEEIRSLGGHIYTMPRTVPQNYFQYKRELTKFFQQHKEYYMIHGHLHSTAFLYHKIAKQNGDRCCITHSHNDGFDHSAKGYLSYGTSLLAQKYTDIYFGCSQAACHKFFPGAIKQGKKMIIVKNGIESERYRYDLHVRDDVRVELGLGNRFVVGHIGRFFPQKNHDKLLKIFVEILKQRPDSILILVGEGPLFDQVKKMTQKMGIEESVLFLGVRSDVNRLMQAMDAFIFPSLYEGLGIVLIEAQAAGLKCFTSADVVPQEAKVTELLHYINLNEPASVWAEEVLAGFPYYREDQHQKILDSGYDIDQTAKWLEQFYLNHSINPEAKEITV